ncbi:unnamed protein product, partial [Amoebophrya sp. A25]
LDKWAEISGQIEKSSYFQFAEEDEEGEDSSNGDGEQVEDGDSDSPRARLSRNIARRVNLAAPNVRDLMAQVELRPKWRKKLRKQYEDDDNHERNQRWIPVTWPHELLLRLKAQKDATCTRLCHLSSAFAHLVLANLHPNAGVAYQGIERAQLDNAQWYYKTAQYMWKQFDTEWEVVMSDRFLTRFVRYRERGSRRASGSEDDKNNKDKKKRVSDHQGVNVEQNGIAAEKVAKRPRKVEYFDASRGHVQDDALTNFCAA